MKKLLCMILIIAAVVSLNSCSMVPGGKPEDEPSADPVKEEDYTGELYDKLNGVWVKQDGYATTFFSLWKNNGTVTYTAGVPFRGYTFGGPVDEITKTGSIYFFTVHLPERKADEVSEGWAAHDITLTVGTTRIGEDIINVTDYAADGKPFDFTRYADDLGSVDWSPLFKEDEPEQKFDTALADELWERASGIWLSSNNGDNFFSEFAKDGDTYTISQGVPASGYVIGAVATAIVKTDDTYVIDLHIPERHDSGEGSELDYDAFDVQSSLAFGDDGSMSFTLWAESGEAASWNYWAPDWDSVDWEAYFDSLSEG